MHLRSFLAAIAASTTAVLAQTDNDISPPSYPSPWARGNAQGWEDAYAKARAFVSGLSLLEKVNLTTGIGWTNGACVGSTGDIPRLNFHGLW